MQSCFISRCSTARGAWWMTASSPGAANNLCWVNVSRGGLVNNAALLRGLSSGALRGAALDVIDGEPSPPPDILAHPAVVVTPHVAFLSAASLAELRRRAAEDVVCAC